MWIIESWWMVKTSTSLLLKYNIGAEWMTNLLSIPEIPLCFNEAEEKYENLFLLCIFLSRVVTRATTSLYFGDVVFYYFYSRRKKNGKN